MAVKKVVTDGDIGQGLEINGNKLTAKVDGATVTFTPDGKLQASASVTRINELQDLQGNSLGHLVNGG